MAMTANQSIVIQLSQDGKFYEAWTRDKREAEPAGVSLISRSATASTVTTAVATEVASGITTGGT